MNPFYLGPLGYLRTCTKKMQLHEIATSHVSEDNGLLLLDYITLASIYYSIWPPCSKSTYILKCHFTKT